MTVAGAADPQGVERSAWAIRLSTLLTVALVAAPIAFATFVAQYEPLTNGSMGGVTAAGSRSIQTLGEPGTLIWLNHDEGGEFFAAFTVANAGPVGVTIKDLARDELNKTVEFFPVEVLVHPGEPFTGAEHMPYDEWDPFEPFSLDPGEERRVAVRYRFGPCNLGRGDSIDNSGYGTTFSVFGIDRTVEFQLPYTLAMRGVPEGGCP